MYIFVLNYSFGRNVEIKGIGLMCEKCPRAGREEGARNKYIKGEGGSWGHTKRIEYIYIRGEFREYLDMNFVSPFQPEREFKVYKSYKCSQIICSRVH